jgi:uncharacterized protein (TIGR02246 family)
MRKILSAMILVTFMSLAHAGPSEDAYRVVEKWCTAFGDADVDGIVKLYAPDALMIGTVGKTVLTRPEQIRQYFDVALNRYKPRTAKLNSSAILVVDDNTVVIAGFDTITGVKDGQPTTNMGRVTFVVAKRGPDWVIVHLHRSPLPTP